MTAKTPTQTAMPDLVLVELPDASDHGIPSFSPFCLKVHAALAVLDLPYERRNVSRPQELKSVNVTGQAPVLLVDGVPVPDSTRIFAKLDELTGGGLYLREDGAILAEDRLYEELADTSINGFLVASRWADDRNWPRVLQRYFAAVPAPLRKLVAGTVRKRVLGGLHARDVTRRSMEDCWERFGVMLDDLDRRAPSEGYWLGDAIGASDLALYGQVRSFSTPLTPWQAGELAKRTKLAAYIERVDALVTSRMNARFTAPRAALRSAA